MIKERIHSCSSDENGIVLSAGVLSMVLINFAVDKGFGARAPLGTPALHRPRACPVARL